MYKFTVIKTRNDNTITNNLKSINKLYILNFLRIGVIFEIVSQFSYFFFIRQIECVNSESNLLNWSYLFKMTSNKFLNDYLIIAE